ncbi:protein of unknown function [Candidatus Nitrotoga arctica]|uniref:Addiction module killer protein n=1 Tax=Candidatus Nitrotoga arctica TaxID=453162 RepID=A0ABN8AI89_9PROT|nr:protein of unknown function [Candidatus Nitrotoga arctica]
MTGGPGYRVYLAKDGDTLIILFGGGTKRGQQKDIDKERHCTTNTRCERR